MARRSAGFGRVLAALVVVGLGGAGSSVAPAAVITFGAAQTIGGDTDVSTAGTLERALSFGAAPVTSKTVNGVTFDGFHANANVPSTTVGSTTLAVTGSNVRGDNTAFASASSPFSTLSSAYKSLLGSAAYVHSAGNYTLTVTLADLEVGQAYQLQVWVNDSRLITPQRYTTIAGGGGNSVTLDYNNTNADGGVGQFVFGTFTADSASQSFTLNNTGDSANQLNALQLRAVPEPAFGAAGILVGLMTLGRRKRAADKARG